jgi:aminoglycoside phosphotransferase (APT) family kinase protein
MEADLEIERGKRPGSMPATRDSKDALARKVHELTSEEFVRERIFPVTGARTVTRGAQFMASVVQNTGTGRLTLLYEFGPDCGVVAKLYSDDLGLRSYAALQTLRSEGFGSASRYQVPEPLGFLADHNLLLMRRMPGVAISAALRDDRSFDLVESCREAARWLAKLHGSALAIDHHETDWESLKLFRMCTRFLKAAAAKPKQLDTMRNLMDEVEASILRLRYDRRFVPTHGRYHADHVFISPHATCVIDLDRVGWSDPGKDLAEFLRVLRSTAFKNCENMTRIDLASSAFLEEYLGQFPEGARTLACYWAGSTFHSYLGAMKASHNKERRTSQELLEFYCKEIHYALRFAI